MSRTLRIAYFGTPEFAVPTLERILDGPHPVVAVVSQPDRGRGRGRRRSPSPVSALALEAGCPLWRPEQVGDPEVLEALRGEAPDLGVVAAFGQFLPRKVRELPTLGYLINAHASLLPRHRGAAPIARALLEGDDETGISVMRVEREMDAGPVALVRRTPIRAEETCGELTARLAVLAADAIAEALDRIAAGEAHWTPQDPARATLAPKIEREEARLDWRDPAEDLARRVRAMTPQPGAFALFAGERLRVLRARAVARDPTAPAGTVHRPDGATLLVATGRGWLALERVQPAGGRPMDVDAFLRGHRVEGGLRLELPGEAPGAS